MSEGQGVGQAVNQAVENHMVKAIITTLCCCWIPGIVAIVFAAQVNSKMGSGDVAGAQAASKQANLWGNVAIGIGIVVWIISLIYGILATGEEHGFFDFSRFLD